MIRIVSSLVVLSIGVLSAQGDPQGPVFRGAGEIVPVFVTVTGDGERLLTDLTREDFEVRDNGRPQPIAVFDNSPRPVRLIVLLDVSGSMVGNLNLVRAAADQLFANLGPDDLARVGTFGDDIIISPTFTRDRAVLQSALPRTIEPASSTPLWRAVDQAMDGFEDGDERKVILVLSDGKDAPRMGFRDRFISQLEIVDRAQRDNVMIYGVGFRGRPGPLQPGQNPMDAMTQSLPDPGLGRTATETGGGYFELRPRDALATTFKRVMDELHSQYLIGFTPTARDGKSHRIEVRLKNKDGKPRARRAYQAPAQR